MSSKVRLLSLLLSITIICGILSPAVLASSLNDELTLYGEAKKIYDDAYELTECDTWQSGSAWISEKINTKKDFEVDFSYYAGDGRDDYYGGADGIVLAFAQKIGLGSDGEYLGFVSGDTYGVEFDSYSENSGDPRGKHIAVIHGQSSNHITYVLDDRVDDSVWHDVKAIYSNENLEIYLDGEQILFCEDVNLADEIYLGLSAATGSGKNRHIISGFKYSYLQDDIADTEFRFSSNTTINCVSKNTIFDIYVGYYVDGILDGTNYICTVDDESIIQINDSNWDSSRGQHLSLTAKSTGSTMLRVINLDNNATGSIDLNVVNSETVYSFDKVPQMTIEDGKITNFYNFSGMVVDDFNYNPIKSADGKIDHYAVTMTIYNTLDIYGAVTAYNPDGSIYDYCVIDKFTSMDSSFVDSIESLIKQTGDLFYLIGNNQYYSGEGVSQHTPISVDVPVGGYLEISNNNAVSPVALFANMTGITIDFMATTSNLISNGKELLSSKDLIVNQVLLDAFTKNYVGEQAVKTIKGLAKQELKNGDWSLHNFGDGLQSVFQELENSGINLMELLTEEIISVTGLAQISESVIMDIIPTGQIIQLLYTLSDVGEIIVECVQYNKSVDYPQGIYLYTSAFSDVTTEAYYSDSVHWAMINDVTSGTDSVSFSPDMPCERAQMVTFLWRAAGEPQPKNTQNPFVDISVDSYYYTAVLWAVEQGITSGISPTMFGPNELCTRSQAVTFLYRYAGAPKINSETSFRDVSTTAYYANAVKWAVMNEVTSGTSTSTFSPMENCSRAQIVTFLYRYMR